ncbi:MAG TPA: hypothetical protein VHE35_36250 [Kofleriaceae bacterium]|nr:hypothetical protein [Kofleriaceae bacterium]
MFVAVERLLIRLRQPASRAGELVALRARLRDELAAGADDDERALAREVHDRKLQLAAVLGSVVSCRTCAVGQPRPMGHHDGGACCSGVTAELFDERELAALVHAGTRAHDLTPPAGADAHAGCAFRGPRGCTLAVEHRPGRCVHYLCDSLRRELHRLGRLDATEAALAEHDAAMRRFTAARQARLDRELAAPLVAALESATATRRR